MATSQSGMSTTALMRGKQMNHRAYCYNGYDRPRKFDGENWNFVGIDINAESMGSVAFALATPDGAGDPGLIGEYYYYIVAANKNHPVNGGSFVESLPTARYGPYNPEGQAIDITLPTAVVDSQITHWNIYRNKTGVLDSNSQDETKDFFLVASVAVATGTYEDTVQDSSLSTIQISFKKELPFPGKVGSEWGQRLWLSNFDPYTTGTATKNPSGAGNNIVSLSSGVSEGFKGLWFKKDGEAVRYEITAVDTALGRITLGADFSGTLSSSNFVIFSDNSIIYASEINDYDAWGFEGPLNRNFLRIGGAGKNEDIVGHYPLGDYLYVFTLDNIYAISNESVDFNQIVITPAPLIRNVGLVSDRAIKEDSGVLYWLSKHGLMRWRGEGLPELVSGRLGRKWLSSLDMDDLSIATVGIHPQYVKVSVPETTGDTENGKTYTFDKFSGNFFPEKFKHPGDYLRHFNSSGQDALFYSQGNFIFEDEVGTNDGHQGTTKSGDATGGSTTSLVYSTGGFYTTGEGLKERYVHMFDANNEFKASRRISSNNGTTLQWTTALSESVVSGWKFYVAPVYWWWVSKEYTMPEGQIGVKELLVEFDLYDDDGNRIESTNSKLFFSNYIQGELQSGRKYETIDKTHKILGVDKNGSAYRFKIGCVDVDNQIAIRHITLVPKSGGKQ